jgi:PHD/YefM family antitoxin component YafN of YafNO toxin-antitoxin module
MMAPFNPRCFYILKKQIKQLVAILNKIHPEGNYQENDDYQFEQVQREMQKDFQ